MIWSSSKIRPSMRWFSEMAPWIRVMFHKMSEFFSRCNYAVDLFLLVGVDPSGADSKIFGWSKRHYDCYIEGSDKDLKVLKKGKFRLSWNIKSWNLSSPTLKVRKIVILYLKIISKSSQFWNVTVFCCQSR